MRRLVFALATVVAVFGPACAETIGDVAARRFLREDLRIPMPGAGPHGLEALLIRPGGPGRYPLALINHGSPRTGTERPKMSAQRLLPQATEFARRGWAAVVIMRRGYASSGGGWAERYGTCDDPDYVTAGKTSAADLLAAVVHLSRRADIDPARIISVGVSAGGFATVALTAEQPAGLLAAINFAGGRGSLSADEVCEEDALVKAFRTFGARSRVPMLWIYAENDRFFGPALARRLRDAFVSAGGRVELVHAPAFGKDGHTLFTGGIAQWAPHVDKFLKARNLVLRDTLLAPPVARLTPPQGLSEQGRKAFENYLAAPAHKAFAVAPGGGFGWRSGRASVEEAKAGALENCGRDEYRLVAVDDGAVR